MSIVPGAGETQPCGWPHVAGQLRERPERILGYVPEGRCSSQDGQLPDWR